MWFLWPGGVFLRENTAGKHTAGPSEGGNTGRVQGSAIGMHEVTRPIKKMVPAGPPSVTFHVEEAMNGPAGKYD